LLRIIAKTGKITFCNDAWCIDPNGGEKPEFGKIDAKTKS